MKIKKPAVKTKKSGRPKLRENKKSSRVNVSMTEEQRVILEEKAAVANLSASAFLLKTGLSKKIVPPVRINLEALTQIKSIKENLNELIELLEINARFDLSATEILVSKIHNDLFVIRQQLTGKGTYEEAEHLERKIYLQDVSDAQLNEEFIN